MKSFVCFLKVCFQIVITGTTSPNPFDLGEMRAGLTETGARPKKGVQSIIEEHSNLVNLDNLLTTSKNQGEMAVFFLKSILSLL